MQEGFSFEWNAGSNPLLTTPDGARHELEVQNLVPVLPVVGDDSCTGGTRAEEISSPSSSSSNQSPVIVDTPEKDSPKKGKNGDIAP